MKTLMEMLFTDNSNLNDFDGVDDSEEYLLKILLSHQSSQIVPAYK